MKMNATSLYVSTCRLIILADASDKSSWIDLFRLVPYLRQSLSCTVCGNLLKEPYTPTSSGCQHHVCKNCKGGRKKLKPSCGWCKDYENYTENLQLRILLQCYKKLCEYFMGTDTYKTLLEEDEIAATVNGGTVASSGLIDLIQEGAGFFDDYKSTAGSGNKITIKRKAVDETDSPPTETSTKESKSNQLGFKKPSNRSRSSTSSKRKGCRCGNATATPGKLTCCGQRCPCYVESKPCTECKCKGCRNPHRPDGMKVRPHIPQLDTLQQNVTTNPDSSPSCSGSMDSLDTDTLTMEAMEESLSFTTELDSSNIKVYTSQLQEISPSLPATIMMDEELPCSPGADADADADADGDDDADGYGDGDGDLDGDADDLSSPHNYTQCSPQDCNDNDTVSPQSGTHDVNSDIEVDV
ncbi:jg13950 [Pararge aegeria aegeria]|uniref:E3 ubiquitin-protein ligase MSL2 n=1 Tax=Pararge aegeria aegeria TaxID=348720 RepID=A0A8S4RU55_9NEOP|nr:jg13950 [Pararge aegeria aegeria]